VQYHVRNRRRLKTPTAASPPIVQPATMTAQVANDEPTGHPLTIIANDRVIIVG
jgi:hypothetical protein